MKRTLFSIFLLTLSLIVNAQQLTFEQLIKIKELPVDDAADFLASKGWKFYRVEEREDETYYHEMFFTHSQTPGGEFDVAPHWIVLYYDEEGTGKVSYITGQKIYYDIIKSAVKANKMQKMDEVTQDKKFIQTYLDQRYQVDLGVTSAREHYDAGYMVEITDI